MNAAVLRKYFFQFCAPRVYQFINGKHFAVYDKYAVIVGCAKQHGIGKAFRKFAAAFHNKVALHRREQSLHIQPLLKGKAEFIAECHFAHVCGSAALFYNACGKDCAVSDAFINGFHDRHGVFVIGQTARFANGDTDHIHF